jgi:4-amino-4-deoxy-L-arabinose transferase-like glycosyltransferase
MPGTLDAVTHEPETARVKSPRELAGLMPSPQVDARAESRRLWRDVALVTALALGIRLLQLDRPPQFDELYHVIAARSWATDGTLTLGGGTYTRAAGFTILIGILFKLFGTSLVVARLPSILAGAVWVAAVHRWTGRKLGRGAGAVTGVLFALDPGAIYLSEFARFYALQGLFVWLGAASVYALVEERRTGRDAWMAATGTLLAWGLALYLQVTTLVAVAGVGVWAALRLASRLVGRARQDPRGRRVLIVLVLAVVLLAAAAVAAGVAGRLWSVYRQTPIWGEPTMKDWHYYERWFLFRYPALWLLLPLAAGTALLVRWRVAVFAITVFLVSMVIFSGAALKTERYIYFIIPFFFAIWGVAVVTWLPWGRRSLASLVDRLVPPAWPPRVRQTVGWGAALLLGIWFLMYDPAFAMTGRMVLRDRSAAEYQETDWGRGAPELRHLADAADVVVSTALPKTLFYIGRAEVTLSLTELGELGRKDGKPIEFNIDPRTGRPAISSPKSLARLMACYPHGLVLIEDQHWRNEVVIPDSTRAFLMAHTEEVPLPPVWLLHARRWTNAPREPDTDCPPLRAGRP